MRPVGRARRAKRRKDEADPGNLAARIDEAASQLLDWLAEQGLPREAVPQILNQAGGTLVALLVVPLGDEADFTPRIEANALTALAFRNGPLEDYHASGQPVGDAEMRDLMISASRRLYSLLRLRDALHAVGPAGQRFWRRLMVGYHRAFCARWETTERGEIPW